MARGEDVSIEQKAAEFDGRGAKYVRKRSNYKRL